MEADNLVVTFILLTFAAQYSNIVKKTLVV